MALFLVISLFYFVLVAQAREWIVPGTVWYDTDGNKIDAHGGGMWKIEQTYFFTGASVSNDVEPRTYTSTDLTNWVNRGIQFPIPNMYRPKMFYAGSRYWIFGR